MAVNYVNIFLWNENKFYLTLLLLHNALLWNLLMFYKNFTSISEDVIGVFTYVRYMILLDQLDGII